MRVGALQPGSIHSRVGSVGVSAILRRLVCPVHGRESGGEEQSYIYLVLICLGIVRQVTCPQEWMLTRYAPSAA